MQSHHRALALIPLLCVAALALLAACGGDDNGNGGSTGGSESARPTASGSPVIAPEQLNIEDALDELTAIEEMIRNPDKGQVENLGIAPSDVDLRIRDTFEGVTNKPGLKEVRRFLESGPENEDDNRILAGETLYNITFATITPTFGASDADTIPPDEIAQLDPLHGWAVDPGDGLPVTAIWKNAVARIIFLWYRL